MIKRLVVAALLLAPIWANAQDVEQGGAKKATIQKPSRDFFMFELNYQGWVKPDSIKTKGIGRGVDVYLCYDFPIKKSHFSFAAGIGVSTSNIYLRDQQIINTDTFADARFGPETTIDYKRYKMTTAFLSAPFELRFYGNKNNRNTGFKAAIGLKVGTLLGAHVKGKQADTKINYKENSKKYLDTWSFAPTLRLGYGNFTLVGSYNITNMYKDGQGPVITPYSIGLCLTGL